MGQSTQWGVRGHGAAQQQLFSLRASVWEKSEEEEGGGRWTAGGGRGLLDDHAAGQVLGVVLEELGRGPGAVGELQLLQLLQLDEAGQAGGGQQGAAWGQRSQR